MRDDNEVPIVNPNSVVTKSNGLVFDNNNIKYQLQLGQKSYDNPRWWSDANPSIIKGSNGREDNLDKAWFLALVKNNKALGINTSIEPANLINLPFTDKKFKVKNFDRISPVDYIKTIVGYHNIKAALDLEHEVYLYKKTINSSDPKLLADYRNKFLKGFQLWNINGHGEIVDNANPNIKISKNYIDRERITETQPSGLPGAQLIVEQNDSYGGHKFPKVSIMAVDITDKDFYNYNPYSQHASAINMYLKGFGVAMKAKKNVNTALSNLNQLVWASEVLSGQLDAKLAALTSGFRAVMKEDTALGIGSAIGLFGNEWFASLPVAEKIHVIKANLLFQYNKGSMMSMDGIFGIQNSGSGDDTLKPVVDRTGKTANKVLDYYLMFHDPKFIESKFNPLKLTSVWDPVFGFGQDVKRKGDTREIAKLTKGHVTTVNGEYQKLSYAEYEAYKNYAAVRGIKIYSPDSASIKYSGPSNLVPKYKKDINGKYIPINTDKKQPTEQKKVLKPSR